MSLREALQKLFKELAPLRTLVDMTNKRKKNFPKSYGPELDFWRVA